MDPIVLQALGVILVLFFIFTMVMSAKTWKWFNIFVAFLVFGASIYFAIEAAFVLKTQKVWREMYNSLAKQLEPEVKKTESLIHGNAENPADPSGTLPSVTAEFVRATAATGRKWKGCTPDQIQPTQLVLTTPASAPPPAPANAPPAAAPPAEMPPMPADGAAPPADGAAPPADGAAPVDPAAAPMPAAAPEPPRLEVRPNGIREKTILYVFKEQKLNESLTVPFHYLGEWEVQAATDTNVTLKPTIPLDNAQLAIMNEPGTFMIYEMLPIDAMSAFDDFFAQARVERTAEQLMAMIPKKAISDPKLQAAYDKAYQAMIDSYVRDGKEALPTDDPENVWTQVKFLKTKEVTVDSGTTQITKDSPAYDSSGLAVLPHLRRSEPGPMKFTAGDVGVFRPSKELTDMLNDGTCEKVASIYRRPLNDYKLYFHQIYNRVDNLVNRIDEVKRQVAAIDESNKQIEGIIAILRDKKTKLESDEVRFKAEVVAVTSYANKLEKFRDEARARVIELYKSNLAMADQIATRQREISEEIGNRTAQAATPAK